MISLEERCASLKTTIDQLNISLERAAGCENDLRSEIQALQRALLETSTMSQSSTEKLKQVFSGIESEIQLVRNFYPILLS